MENPYKMDDLGQSPISGNQMTRSENRPDTISGIETSKSLGLDDMISARDQYAKDPTWWFIPRNVSGLKPW